MCYFGLICSPICERAACIASKAATRDKISSGAGECGGFLINLDMVMSMRVGPDVSDKMYWSAITQRRIKAANFTFSLISFDEPNYFQRHVSDDVLPNWIFPRQVLHSGFLELIFNPLAGVFLSSWHVPNKIGNFCDSLTKSSRPTSCRRRRLQPPGWKSLSAFCAAARKVM